MVVPDSSKASILFELSSTAKWQSLAPQQAMESQNGQEGKENVNPFTHSI